MLDKLFAQKTAGLLVMLLDNLEESRVVQLGEERKVMDVSDHIRQVFFQILEALLKMVSFVTVRVKFIIRAGIVSGLVHHVPVRFMCVLTRPRSRSRLHCRRRCVRA